MDVPGEGSGRLNSEDSLGKRVISLIAVLVVGATSVLFTAQPAAAAVSVTIRSMSADKCLDVDGGLRASGSGVSVYSCHGGANQKFALTGLIADISTYDGLLCLDTYRKETHDGARVVVAYCDGGPSQKWSPTSTATSGVWRYIHQQTQKCLDVLMSRTRNGTPVIIWSCHNGSNQMWSARAIS